MAMAKEKVLGTKTPGEPHDHSVPEWRRRMEKSLESGLEDTFPGSDAISVIQPAPGVYDRTDGPEGGGHGD